MANDPRIASLQHLGTFWWVFALRGSFALLFSAVLFVAGSLFRVFFLDPPLITLLGLMLGFYVMGNGLLFAVAAVVAEDHRLHLWWLLLAESVAVLALGVYIGFTLLLTPQSLALLAGLHALIAGASHCALALKLRHYAACLSLLGLSGLVSFCAGLAFLAHQGAAPRHITNWLALLELVYGLIALLFSLQLRKDRARSTPLSAA